MSKALCRRHEKDAVRDTLIGRRGPKICFGDVCLTDHARDAVVLG